MIVLETYSPNTISLDFTVGSAGTWRYRLAQPLNGVLYIMSANVNVESMDIYLKDEYGSDVLQGLGVGVPSGGIQTEILATVGTGTRRVGVEGIHDLVLVVTDSSAAGDITFHMWGWSTRFADLM